MNLDKCTVTGRVSRADGTPVANASVTFRLSHRDRDGDVTILPAPVAVETDADGNISVDLWPNARGLAGTIYTATIAVPAAASRTIYPPIKLVVPDAATASFADIQEGVQPVPVNDAIRQVALARLARDEAEGYRDETKALHDEVMPLAGAVAVVSENVDAIQDAAALLAGGYTASTIPSASLAVIKMLDTATFPVVYRNDPGVEGFYQWNATISSNFPRADKDEISLISPDLTAPGAYIRVQLPLPEYKALNRALNVRPFEAPPSVLDRFNAIMPPVPAFGSQVNLNSNSENLAGNQYSKNPTIVDGDTINWNGITLQRLTNTGGFAWGVRDVRVNDYPVVPGQRYIASVVVCAPFIETDTLSGIPGPWTRFMWMQGVASGTTFGSGAKLIGPTPRRVSILLEAATTSTFKVVANPRLSLSEQAASNSTFWWFINNHGLGIHAVCQDIYLGGMQLEKAPNQTEKYGVITVGTSIDVGGGGAGNGSMWTTGRGWPRWFEGLMDVPVYCASIGGQVSSQILARFDTDIAPLANSAKYILLCHNVNDFNGLDFDSATYRANWQAITEKALALGLNVVHMTPQRDSAYPYPYSQGAQDKENEIAYIKATYPFVIDRDDVLQDAINANLVNRVYDTDGIHQNVEGNRAFAFMLYHKYRHFFAHDNVPGPYQKTTNNNDRVQSFGKPVWLNRMQAVRVTSTAAGAILGTETGTAPYLIFEAALSGAVTYQLPCANYQRPGERTNTDVQVQKVLNLTGQNIYIQYYKRDVANIASTVGSAIGPIPNGQCWTVATDGVTAWREQ